MYGGYVVFGSCGPGRIRTGCVARAMEVAVVKGKGCDSARPWHAPLRFAQGRGADEASAPTLALIDSQ
jgi:hypothetical protein